MVSGDNALGWQNLSGGLDALARALEGSSGISERGNKGHFSKIRDTIAGSSSYLPIREDKPPLKRSLGVMKQNEMGEIVRGVGRRMRSGRETRR